MRSPDDRVPLLPRAGRNMVSSANGVIVGRSRLKGGTIDSQEKPTELLTAHHVKKLYGNTERKSHGPAYTLVRTQNGAF